MRDEKTYYKQTLRARLTEVLRMLDRDTPHAIVAAQFILALKAMIGFAPSQFFATLFQAFQPMIRQGAGFCERCGKDLTANPGYESTDSECKDCLSRSG